MLVTIKKIDNGYVVERSWMSGLAQRSEYAHDAHDAIELASLFVGEAHTHLKAEEEAAELRKGS